MLMKSKSYEGFDEDIYIHFGSLRSQFLAITSGITYPDPKYTITRKNASHFSIEYVYEGAGVINHGSDSYKAGAGDFFILHPNTYHHYFSDKKNPWKKIFLTVHGDPKFLKTQLALYNIDNICFFKGAGSPFQLERILELVKDDAPDIDHELEVLVLRMITELSDLYHAHAPTSVDKMSAAKSFIERRVSTKLSVNEVAEFVNLDRSYLSRQFSKTFGLSPTEYIILSKIEYAMNLLQNSDMSVKMIAEQLSFTYTPHFSERFRHYTGYSPVEFRNKFKSGA